MTCMLSFEWKLEEQNHLRNFCSQHLEKPSSDQRLSSSVLFEQEETAFYASNKIHIVQHHHKRVCGNSTTICHVDCITMKEECLEKPKCGHKSKTVTEMERVVVVHFKHVLPQGAAAPHKRSSEQRCRSIKKSLRQNSFRFSIWASEPLISLF